MAREAIDYAARDWKSLQAGGTEITAAALNNMETGIANATAAINKVDATVLTYLVASGGDKATTDINGAPITGPCYVEDLSNGNRWLDKGDGSARVRTGVSVAEYEALRDSVGRRVLINDLGGYSATGSFVSQTVDGRHAIILNVEGDIGNMSLFVNMDGSVVLFDEDNRKEIWSKNLIA